MVYFLALSIIVALSIWLFMQQPQFGRKAKGNRLKRIQESPNYANGAFQNLNHTPALAEGVSPVDILKSYINPPKDRKPANLMPSVKTNLNALPTENPVVVWFGHSSYLIKIGGKTLLIDPVFSGTASPVSFFGKNYAGTNEYGVDSLPEIDILIITHDHYDHMDYKTIKQLVPRVGQVVTSLGVGAHLERWGFEASRIQELDWGQKTELPDSISLTAVPARHFSGRGFKRNQTLWSSFVFQSATHKIYVGGDSGYDSHFKEIGAAYGPFDLAILECGQYNEFWKYIHMMPEQTAQAALDLQAKKLMPVHWAKFTLSLHAWYEPIERVVKHAQILNLPLVTPIIGQPVEIGKDYPNNEWWR
jgi:L-ascorbate metabolism protein UlaG (beta-lactamase superfamily)